MDTLKIIYNLHFKYFFFICFVPTLFSFSLENVQKNVSGTLILEYEHLLFFIVCSSVFLRACVSMSYFQGFGSVKFYPVDTDPPENAIQLKCQIFN